MVLFGSAVGLGAFLLARLLVAVVGPPRSLGDPRWLFTSAAHGQMPLWLVGGTAVAVAVLGAALIAGDRARSLTWPLTATGQLALTVYVGHLLVLHAAQQVVTSQQLSRAIVILAGFTVAILLLATLWRRYFARGPLEQVLHATWLDPAPSRAAVRRSAADHA